MTTFSLDDGGFNVHITPDKVYVLTDGLYSEFHIIGVFRTEHDAEVYCAIHRRELEYPEIHEYEIFPGIDTESPVMMLWDIEILQDGTILSKKNTYTLTQINSVSCINEHYRPFSQPSRETQPLYRVTLTLPKGKSIEEIEKAARDRLAQHRYEALEKEMLSLKEEMGKE